MATERRQRYIAGTAVRNADARVRAESKVQQKRRRRVKEEARYVNLLYTFFLVAAACLVLWSCVNYLKLHAETTTRMKSISSLETRLEDLRKENDDYYTRIMTSVDLEYVREVAVEELGMVYASEDQVIFYDSGTDDYVRQNEEIPSQESSLVERILGKK